MENKYYDLIISLIKEHRKYAEYESIENEIANHVQEQAKTVLCTISNDDVIISYLNKIINTAYITVPKKLGYSSRNNKATTIEYSTLSNVVIAETAASIETETPTESLENQFEDADDSDSIFDEIVNNDNEINTNEDSHKNLVDQMINGTTSHHPEENNIEDNELEELYDSLDNIESNEIEVENDDVVDGINTDETTDTISEIDSTISEIEGSFEEDFLSQNDFEIADLNESDSFDLLEDAEEEEEEEEETELVPEEAKEEEAILETEEETPVENNILEEEVILETEEETEIELNIDLSFEDETKETEEIETINTVEDDNIEIEIDEEGTAEEVLTETSGLSSIYDYFEYETVEIEPVNTTEIIELLNSMDKKYPEKQILNICNLKYKQNLSISDISEQTGFSNDKIIEILNEIIETVKD